MEIHKNPWFQSAPTRYYNGINDNGATTVGLIIKPNWGWFNYNNITNYEYPHDVGYIMG